jgi:transcriptional regulator with XRE-family HTH domain
MIDWKRFNVEELTDGEEYLLFMNGSRVIHATYDASNEYFTYSMIDGHGVIPIGFIRYYAEMNWPDEPVMNRHEVPWRSTMTIGKKLKNLRERRGWTQHQAGKEIGVTSQVISNYERDYREPSKEVLIRIADVYKTTVDELFGRTESAQAQPGADLEDLFKNQMDQTLEEMFKKENAE